MEARIGSAGFVIKNFLFVTGGHGNDRRPLSGTELISLRGRPRRGPKLPQPLSYHCALLVKKSSIFVNGGISFPAGPPNRKSFLYSLRSRKWTHVPDIMTRGRMKHDCAIFDETTIIVAGGEVGADILTREVEIFHLSSMSWTRGPRLLKPLSQGVLMSTSGRV